jgi:hypothetical protein
MTPFAQSMSSPFGQKYKTLEQNIRSLESKPNLSISEQIDLNNYKSNLQSLRGEASGESQFRIGEKESLLREKELEESMAFQPQESELRRLKLGQEQSQIQSQMAFQPQMDAIRGGVLGRMAQRLGLPQAGGMGGGFGSGFPQMGTMGGAGSLQPAQSFQGGMNRSSFGSLGMQSYGSSMGSMGGGSLTPSWMQSYQSPQFPRY